MSAAMKEFQYSAHNVSRNLVPGAEPVRASHSSDALGGVTTQSKTTPASEAEKKAQNEFHVNSINLAEEAIYQIRARNAFGSSLEVVKTSLKMHEHILDIKV